MKLAGSEDVPGKGFDQRIDQAETFSDSLGHRRALQFRSFPRVDLRLPVQWEMVGVLGGQDVAQQPRPGKAPKSAATAPRPARCACTPRSRSSLRGQFEERISQIVREASQAPDVILFIDEIHTIVGAGGGGGALDAAQIMKPALARGEIDCIGATTQDEFNQFIRKDAALERRFSPVQIGELSDEATLRVLQGVAPRVSAKHAESGSVVEFEAEALKAAVNLTNRYVKDRQQPDKAIDALDIAAARATIAGRNWVTAEDIAAVVAEWTGIQVQRLTEDDRARFTRMEQILTERVIGQDAAVKALSQSVRAAMAGVKAANRPSGYFCSSGLPASARPAWRKSLRVFCSIHPMRCCAST